MPSPWFCLKLRHTGSSPLALELIRIQQASWIFAIILTRDQGGFQRAREDSRSRKWPQSVDETGKRPEPQRLECPLNTDPGRQIVRLP